MYIYGRQRRKCRFSNTIGFFSLPIAPWMCLGLCLDLIAASRAQLHIHVGVWSMTTMYECKIMIADMLLLCDRY